MNKKFILRKNEEIGALIKLRKSVGNRYFAIYYNLSVHGPRIAISVSKKYGNAVRRNYEKRVIREIMRDIIPILPKIDILIVVKKDLKQINFQEKENNLKHLINKIIKKTGE